LKIIKGGAEDSLKKYSPPKDFPIDFMSKDIVSLVQQYTSGELSVDLMSEINPVSPSDPILDITAFNVESFQEML